MADSKYSMAAIATQEVLLDLAAETDSGIDGFARKLDVDVSNWLDEPAVSYCDFLRACGLLGESATDVFKRTRERLREKAAASNGGQAGDDAARMQATVQEGAEDDGLSPDGDDDASINSADAGMGAADDVLLRWSDVREAMAQTTHRTVEQISGLFDGAPHKVSDGEIAIVLKDDSERMRGMASKLLREGIAKAGVINADSLAITFANA